MQKTCVNFDLENDIKQQICWNQIYCLYLSEHTVMSDFRKCRFLLKQRKYAEDLCQLWFRKRYKATNLLEPNILLVPFWTYTVMSDFRKCRLLLKQSKYAENLCQLWFRKRYKATNLLKPNILLVPFWTYSNVWL